MSWRVWSVSTLDWTTKVQITPTTCPWARAINVGKGAITSFALGDKHVAETATEDNLAPWERLIVTEFQGQIMYAGFINASDYDMDAKSLQVTHEDLWAVLKRRLVTSLLADGVQTTALVYTGRSLGNLVKEAIYEGQNDAARFNLPIVLPPFEPGPENKTIEGYELPTVADVLNEYMSTEGGPDIDFFPRWRDDGSIEWYMRMGNLTDGLWEWDVTASKSQASGLRVRKNGTEMFNRVAAIGEGSETKMLVKVIDHSAGSPYLPLDATTSHKGESDPAALAARGRADVTAHDAPTQQVSMDVQMDADFAAHQLRLGGTVRWKVEGDPHLADGWRSSRLIEYSGDLTDKIHLEFQPTGG